MSLWEKLVFMARIMRLVEGEIGKIELNNGDSKKLEVKQEQKLHLN